MKKGWHIDKEQGQVTVCRHLPARFDVSAQTQLAGGDALRLAMQIRQDMWRALRNLRGFSPVVQITSTDGQLEVRAGGRIMGHATANVEAKILMVLQNSENRERWLKCAGFQRFGASV